MMPCLSDQGAMIKGISMTDIISMINMIGVVMCFWWSGWASLL